MRRLAAVAVAALASACCQPTVKGPVMSNSAPSQEPAVERTVASVAHFIDKKQWRELRALYADAVKTDYTSLFGGTPQEQSGDALIGAWQKLLTPIVTQHLLGPIVVDVNGSQATARCHVRGYHYAEGTPGGDEWTVAGHYVFALGKHGEAWRIQAMTLETLYQSGNTKLLEVAGGK